MKKLLLRTLFILIPFLYSIYASSQPQKQKDCSATCFSSEMISVKKLSGTCTAYEIKVSFSAECAHALSHFTVAVPCGIIQNLWNSENWAQSIGTDPTTGLKGFKIDDISGFGEGELKNFTVRFNVCSTENDCGNQPGCWQPLVAYKASTCVNYETIPVNCNTLRASIEKVDASCFGVADGSVSINIESGNEPYSITWEDNSDQLFRSALPAGKYSVVIQDASGESVTLEETIEEPARILISGTTSPASCNGMADGTIDITVSGGAGGYKFLWSDGHNTEDIQSASADSYVVTVTDAKGCQATASFAIGYTSGITVTSTHVKADCNQSNGSIDISVAGGTIPYSYAWQDGATTEDRADLQPGLYTVIVTDSKGCSQKAGVFLKDNNTLTLRATPTPTSCSDDASGAIDLIVSGGVPPFSYVWSNDEITEDLSGLNAGYYTVVVTDSKGCTSTSGFTVSKSTFQVPKIVTQPTCYGDDNGSIIIQEPIGGTGPFTYTWSNNETGTALKDLGPGTYTVTIRDAAGCTRTLTSSITEPVAIHASAQISSSNCQNDALASVDLTVSGGTLPYYYLWSNGATTEDLSGVENGTYSVVITDAHGCSISREITVETQTEPWSCPIIEPAMPICGSANNEISAATSDGASYKWTITSTDDSWIVSAGANTPLLSYVAGNANSSAIFTLAIVKNGCTNTCSVTLSACTPQDNGEGTDPDGDNPGNEEPEVDGPAEGGSQSCEECFATVAKLTNASGSCRTYEVEVNTNGLCRHDLSHWTIAIPCGTISDYSNSNGWKMVVGKDPTTGLTGLKVDDIQDFGKKDGSFSVIFTVCENSSCDLSSWNPTVAYKAGQCVGFESVKVTPAPASETLAVYPNPFTETLRFEWNAGGESVNLQIIDQFGNTISTATKITGKAQGYFITLESSSLPKGIYYYRLTTAGKTYSGKISKK